MNTVTYINIFFLISVFTLYPSEQPKLELRDGIDKLPIVYHDWYDISFGGLEKYHPFDTKKYSKVHNALIDDIKWMKSDSFYTPDMVTETDLKIVHTSEYLESLNYSSTLARICGVHTLGNVALYAVSSIPNVLLRRYLLNPMRYATGGTIKAVELALDPNNKNKYAINLSGGYHHAKANGDHDAGFCAINDMALGIKMAWKKNPTLKRIMICDLDAHQGNGNAHYFGNNGKTGKWDSGQFIKEPDDQQQKVTIFDMYSYLNYSGYNYPGYKEMEECAAFIRYGLKIDENVSGPRYIETLKSQLPQAIKETNPQLIFYNAGTDPYEKDTLGKMQLSKENIIERDAFVFQQAKDNGIPIVMTLSGGYSEDSADIITSSIKNILLNVTEDIGPYPPKGMVFATLKAYQDNIKTLDKFMEQYKQKK